MSHLIDRGAEKAADKAWVLLKHFPYFGVVVTAGVALGAATVIGVPELAITVAAGYAAFKILKLDVPPSRAVREAVKLEEAI